MVGWMHVSVTGIWGGVLALERRAFLQASLSRPLVAGVSTGLLLGDLEAGLYLGVLFELLHLGGASLGGAHADHETLPTIAAVAMASGVTHIGGRSTPAEWTLAALLFAPTGRAGALLERSLDLRARKYFGRVRDSIEAREFPRAFRQNLRAMWPQFVFYGLISACAAALGIVLGPLELALPPRLHTGLVWAWPALGVVATGVAVQGTRATSRLAVAGAAALVAFVAAFGLWYLRRDA